MESKNPVFNPSTLSRLSQTNAWTDSASMTLNGTINKIGILISLTVAASAWSWSMAETDLGRAIAMGSIVVNFILAFVIMFNKSRAPILAPIYAVSEGLGLGFIAYIFDRQTHGVALTAFTCTFAILLGMLGLYRFRILRATETLRRVMGVAMIGILITYATDMILGFFGTRVPMIHEGSPVGILFSLGVIVIASLNFILDFDMIERSVAARAPKWMEWYAGFAVLMTVVWLYLEILRLLNKKR